MKQAKDLSCDEIIALVQSIQSYLYLDLDEKGRECWNPEKAWSGDEFDFIAGALRQYGLVPEKPQPVCDQDEPKRYVLYDFDSDELVGSRDPKTAADDASELCNVIVVPLILPKPITAGAAEVQQSCDCQLPGDFCSGVPGILAKVENCHVVLGGKVERCDQCRRYPSDQAAYDKLVELGMV